MKAKPQPAPPPPRVRVNDHIFELNQAVNHLLVHVRDLESLVPLELRQHGRVAGALAETRGGIDRIHDIMIRLRRALLDEMPDWPPRQGTVPDERATAVTSSPGTIYVVDDNASLRRALSRLMRSVGYEVEAFPSAPQFLERLPDAHPACVVLDVRMPRMSGLDLQAELTALGSDLPIVFITGHGDIDMAVRAMKDGAVDFLPKPFDDQDLLDSVARALRHHEVTRTANDRQREVLERVERLTPREREVFERVVQGMLNKQIGRELGTTEKTVKVHRARVMEKMEAASLADLVRMATDLGIEGPAGSGDD